MDVKFKHIQVRRGKKIEKYQWITCIVLMELGEQIKEKKSEKDI